jgi:hypothetical protein
MRNLLEYPVTHEEIIECLTRLRDREMVKERVGDTTPLLLDLAIAAVQYRQLKLWERGDLHAMEKALGGKQ